MKKPKKVKKLILNIGTKTWPSKMRERDSSEQLCYKQVTRGHNIVVDGWAGASNPYPHPKPHPIKKHT